MQWQLAAGAAALVGAAALTATTLLLPWRVQLSIEARSSPSGMWAIAGGLSMGPLAVVMVAARGVSARMAVHIFERAVLARPLSWLLQKLKKSDGESKERGESKSLTQRFDEALVTYEKLEAWVDPVALGYFLIEEQRRLRVNELRITPVFNADDAAVTGQITAALYMLSAALGANIIIDPQPVWWGEGKADCTVKGDFTVYPGLAALDTAKFVARHVRPPRRRSPRQTPSTISVSNAREGDDA